MSARAWATRRRRYGATWMCRHRDQWERRQTRIVGGGASYGYSWNHSQVIHKGGKP